MKTHDDLLDENKEMCSFCKDEIPEMCSDYRDDTAWKIKRRMLPVRWSRWKIESI